MAIQPIVGQGVTHNRIFLHKCARWSKIAQEDESVFSKLVRSDRFQRELKEGLETLKKDPAQFTDLYEAYRQQKTA